jgi:hypothetical protein
MELLVLLIRPRSITSSSTATTPADTSYGEHVLKPALRRRTPTVVDNS